MALDRQSIEKRDFPIGRSGYESEAVDAHLAQIAEEVEQLRLQAASEQVRAILEVERAAQNEASRIRKEAEADARQTRDDAIRRSREHVGKVGQATAQMLQRVDAMEGELNVLIESLRTAANRLTADLSLLEGGMSDLYDAAGRQPAAPAPDPAEEFLDDDDDDEIEIVAVTEEAIAEEAPAVAAQASGDVEGARLVALNMALNGTSREETDRYLAENFELADREALLDEVYAAVES